MSDLNLHRRIIFTGEHLPKIYPVDERDSTLERGLERENSVVFRYNTIQEGKRKGGE